MTPASEPETLEVRVARALCKRVSIDPDRLMFCDSEVPAEKKPAWHGFADDARAAIEVVVEECARVAEGAAEGSMTIAANNPGTERAHYALRERDAELAVARAIRSLAKPGGQR